MWRYRAFFALLYFIQGAAYAYVVNFQKPFLFAQGISTQTIGLFTSSLLAPFILKIFLGMLSDRVPFGRFGGRKPYMAIGLLLFAFSYTGLAWVSPGEHFTLFWIITWCASLGLALFDTCADGWAIDVASDQEQSYIQASMIAGRSLGLVVMSLAFGWMALSYGFSAIFILLGAMAFVVLLIVFLVPHVPQSTVHQSQDISWANLYQPFYICFAVFGVVYSISSFGTDGLLTLHLSEARGIDSLNIGVYGMARGFGALFGAFAYAMLVQRWGLRKLQWVAILALGLGCLLPLWSLPVFLSGLLWGFCWGFQETAFVTLAMRFSEGAWAATFFALSMIFSNIGTSIGEALGGQLVPHLGFENVFFIYALVAWGSLVFVPKMLKPLGTGN